MTYYSDPEKNEMLDFQLDNDVTAKPGRVKTKGRDPMNRTDVDGDASNESEKDRKVMSRIVEVVDLETGESKNVRQEDTRPTSEESNDAAQREARGKFRRVQQVAVKATLTVEGDPNILAKMVIAIANIGKRLSQKYYIRKATHTITVGYKLKMEIVSDGTGGHETSSKRATGLSRFQVGAPVKGQRAADDQEAAQKIAVGLKKVKDAAKRKGLTPPALRSEVVDGKIIFKDARDRRVPTQKAGEVVASFSNAVSREPVEKVDLE